MSYPYLPEHEKIVDSYLKGDWETVLELQTLLKDAFFLWPKPKRNDLNFIIQSLRKINIRGLISIGCGSGLLEWLLNASSGFTVFGVEIDQNYWRSKYARKSFVDLIFPDENIFSNNIRKKNNALMFCYFNDRDAFLHYLSIYPGKCLIIIGPENCGKHTDPSPFDENIPKEWELWKLREICATGDYIAIYRKMKLVNL